ncbi:hypothetical protein [Deinococcus pimensis]|uniref:hypothetical protein n=1 Tax=Deinococcus pimensis TaxID=309888 RepID=UPI0012FCE8E9|nr:hypothetical protein [Deinococcus pimensis]
MDYRGAVLAVLGTIMVGCGAVPGASQKPLPVDVERGEPISRAEFEKLKMLPDVGVYVITADDDEGKLRSQSVSSCTVINRPEVNRPATNRVDGQVYAYCTATFAYITIKSRLEDQTTFASVDKTFRDSLKRETSAYAGTLPKVNGRRYCLASFTTVSFVGGSTGSGAGPLGCATARSY